MGGRGEYFLQDYSIFSPYMQKLNKANNQCKRRDPQTRAPLKKIMKVEEVHKSLKKQSIKCTPLVLRSAVGRALWALILRARRGGK